MGAVKSDKPMPWRKRVFSQSPPQLPPGWKQYHDPSTNNAYYANRSTGETTWDRPKLTKADKKQLKQQALEAKRARSHSSKTSESSNGEIDIEYTQQVMQEKKVVSFSNEHEVRTYKVEPGEGAVVRKRKKSIPSKKKNKSTEGKPARKQQEKSKAFVPLKRRDKKSSSTEKEAMGKPTSAPSSFTGSGRNKPLKKNTKSKVKSVEGQSISSMTKVASLPSNPNNSDQVDQSVVRLSALPKVSSKPSVKSETNKTNPPQDNSTENESTASSKPTSKIVSLLKPPMTRSKSKTPDSAAKGGPVENKSEPDLPAADKEVESNKQNPENAVATPSRSMTISEKLQALTSSLLGSNELNAQEKVNTDRPQLEARSTSESMLCTPPRKTKEADNGSPASSTLASSLPLTDLMFGKDLEVDTDSIKEEVNAAVVTPEKEPKSGGSPSKLAGIFKKNRSEEPEQENVVKEATQEAKPEPVALVVVTPSKPDEVDVDTTKKEVPVPVATPEKEPKSGGNPSKLVGIFKKNRSKELEQENVVKEATQEAKPEPFELAVVTPTKPEVVSLETTKKEEPAAVAKEKTDGDTHTTNSSTSGIEAEPLEADWVAEDDDVDLGDDVIPVKESRCGDCGCSEQMHRTLLLFGGMIYKVVGKPNDDLRATMEDAGDFFADEESQDGSEY